MFCVHCGKNLVNNASFCSYCGASQAPEAKQTNGENSVATLFQSFFGSTNFLVATVFFLVFVCASALSNITSGVLPIGIFHVLVTIAFFKLQGLAKKGAPLFAFVAPLKMLRIIIKIYRIVLWVLVGVVAVCGAIISFVGVIAGAGLGEIIEEALHEADIYLYDGAISHLGGIALLFIGIIFVFLAAIIAIINAFAFGAFYKTVSSAEFSAQTGKYQIDALGSTRGWLIFTIVCQCISSIAFFADINASTILGLISTGFNVTFTILIIGSINNIKKV